MSVCVAELADRIGWSTIERRVHDAVQRLPGTAVLAGFSMGAAVVDTLLPGRPDTAGALLLHGLAEIPSTARPGLPVQPQVADRARSRARHHRVAQRALAFLDTVAR